MRRALSLLLLGVLLSGCVGATPSKSTASPTGAGGGKPVFDNSTVDGVLRNSPNLQITGGMTLEWELSNATRDKPAVLTTLIRLADDYPVGHQAFDGDVELVAFIPLTAADAVAGCGEQPKPVKSFLRGRDGGGGNNNQNRFGGLTGTFEQGWYHVVLVAIESASFTISFDADDTARPRRLPAADPFVEVKASSVVGGHALVQSHSGPDAAWFGWGLHELEDDRAVDGGRTHKMEVGCQATTAGSSGNSFNQDDSIAASAAGRGTSIEFKGTYTPTLAQTASQETILNAFGVWVKPVEVTAASPTPSAA